MQVERYAQPGHDGMAVVAERISTPVTTTDATPTPVVSWTVPEGRSRWYYVWIIGDDAGSTNSVAYTRRVCIRNTGGTARVIATSATGETHEDGGYSTATIAVAVSGAVATINGTGVAATTINWYGRIREM